MYPDYYNMYNQYYGFKGPDYRSSEPQNGSGEIITLYQAIGLIKQSVGDEKEDEMFYDTLIKQAPTEKEKDIIRSIRDDERKHNQILRRLYYEFTGQMLPADTVTNVPNSNMDYKSNLEKALFGELDAVAKYRKNGQVELILRAMELYGYNLKFMVNDNDITNEERSRKQDKLEYTYQQIITLQAEQVNGKANLHDTNTKI